QASQISLRDLLLHRPGFWNGAINYRTFGPGNLDDEGLRHQLETSSVPSSIEFRYSNLGYVVAAAAMEEVTGIPWEELLEHRVFGPAGMVHSTTSIERAKAGDFAFPFGVSPEGGFEAQPVKVQAQMHAAGGSASSVEDLLRWIRLNLRQGALDGQTVFPARAVRQAQAPQIQHDRAFGPYLRYAYGLGVHHAELDGEWTVHHFGGPIHVSFQPERDRGLVLLSAGTDSTSFVHELARRIYHILGREEGDWAEAEGFRETRSKLEEVLAERRRLRQELAARRGSLSQPAATYLGVYRNERLGDLEIRASEGALHLSYGVLEQELVPLEADTFLADLLPGEDGGTVLEYRVDETGPALFWGERRFGRVEE
ncbi:MAG: serine hydrolase, partial [Acidobacteria bacterium]|nr:serine hydrolase [Acidobacteriota bacterium]